RHRPRARESRVFRRTTHAWLRKSPGVHRDDAGNLRRDLSQERRAARDPVWTIPRVVVSRAGVCLDTDRLLVPRTRPTHASLRPDVVRHRALLPGVQCVVLLLGWRMVVRAATHGARVAVPGAGSSAVVVAE